MQHFWSRKMLSVNGLKAARAGHWNKRSRNPEGGSASNLRNGLTKIAQVLQNSASALNQIHAHLLSQGLLSVSLERQAAQIAIASRCGDSVASGLSFLKALSAPVQPAKFYGPAAAFSGGVATSAPNLMRLQGYEGFKSPLPPLSALPEEHSFLDLFEQLLVCARARLWDRQGVWLGNTVVAGLTGRVLFEHGGSMEMVKYTAQGEIIGRRNDIAQFTGRTISLLSAITDEPLVIS
jgi:hypothetical protein